MTEVLILLQGGNPVPNWAVAAFLLEQGPQFGLACPDAVVILKTREQADPAAGLKDALGQQRTARVLVQQVVDANDGASVTSAVEQALRTLGSAPGALPRVHLNYTGGTKVMAVHAPRGCPTATLSYLDAATHRLWVEGREFIPKPGRIPAEEAGARVRHDLRLYVQLRFEDLWSLHGAMRADRRRPLADAVPLGDATKAMQAALEAGQTQSWVDWAGANRETLKSGAADSRPAIPWPLDQQAVVEAIARDLQQTGSRSLGSSFVQDGQWSSLDGRQRHILARFLLEGGWLERVVEQWTAAWLEDRLMKAREAVGVHKRPVVERNVRVLLGVSDAAQLLPEYEQLYGEDPRTAEIDVLALVGHQLLAISCTTATREVYQRERAFEIWYRARQLGGEEARAMLVSLASREQVGNLKRALSNDYGGVAQVQIVGKDDLASRERFWKRLDEAVGWTE
ncbi:MAG: hypothetical protein HY690_04330 [Chloroflexi bacterium]|nr:hypothetical protein [Chloroflexota bacterium]